MSLLTIFNRMADVVGLSEVSQVMASPDRDCAEAVVMSNAVGEELARRVDFGALRAAVTLTGTGASQTFVLGGEFSRIIPGIAVTYNGAIVRPLTQGEWASLTPMMGAPRYFLLEGTALTLWPYLASGESVLVRYQTKNWCGNNSAAWSADSDISLISETLMTKGLIARWRRQKGMPYQDYEAEYEAAIEQFAEFDDRSRL